MHPSAERQHSLADPESFSPFVNYFRGESNDQTVLVQTVHVVPCQKILIYMMRLKIYAFENCSNQRKQ